ncbi:MAG: Ig-like domain-containing protein, partial [Gemmatimonadetes bacterium]|nr:Ig-like domain-containing protein [Gemmatimonadota bacterium]
MNQQTAKIFVLIALVIGLTNCGSDGTGPDAGGNSVSISRTSVTLTFLGETTQLTATVRNSKNEPVSGQVAWSSDAPTVATVSSNGLVTAIGNGQATLTATAGGLSATASATVQQVPTSLSIISGNAQSDTVGQLLTEPLVVRAEDQGGTAVSAVSVSFSISQSGGSLSETSVTTDSDGEASTTWTLGTTSGTQNVTALIQGSESGKADFSATATPGPATAFSKEWGDQQIGKNDRPLPEPIKAAVKDEFGNGIAGIPVTFSVTDGGGSINPADSVTSETGTAEGTWTMGVVGANTLTASTAGFPDLEF